MLFPFLGLFRYPFSCNVDIDEKRGGEMFLWFGVDETPLSEAVIKDHLETIKGLSKRKDHIFAKNSLGFNALQLAYFLGKEEAVHILHPKPAKLIKMVLPGDSQAKEVDEVEFGKLLNVKYLSHLKFENYALFRKALNNCPLIFRNGWNEEELRKKETQEEGETPESCALRAIHYRRQLLEGYFADVTIRWIDDVLGYGVFTNKDLKAGAYIGEYVGEVRKLSRLHPRFNSYCMRYPSRKWPFPYYIIDSKEQSNEIRFVNHSYEPNLVLKLAVDHQLLHQLFFTCRDIPKGSQLTWNYGKDYWARRKPPVELG